MDLALIYNGGVAYVLLVTHTKVTIPWRNVVIWSLHLAGCERDNEEKPKEFVWDMVSGKCN